MHRSIFQPLMLTGFLLGLAMTSLGQYNFGEVDALLDKNKQLLGGHVVALVYKEGKIIYKKEIGEDFNMKTQAPIASCSKWLTAALVMTLVDEGKLSLDVPIVKYIPILEMYSKRYITLRNCLSHTTGIKADEPGLKSLLQRKKYATLEDEATAIAKREIERNPGEMFFYSSIGLNLAARVCEVVTKKPFDRLIQERITRPLKMRATNFNNGDFNVAPNPSGGAVSTAADYMNFLTMILNRGTFEGKRILSEKAIDEMQKIQTGTAVVKYTPKVAEGFDYGLGEWLLEKDASGKGTVISCPGLFGSFPLVDNCRGYALIIFVKTLLSEQKKEIYLTLKEAIDQQVPSNCK